MCCWSGCVREELCNHTIFAGACSSSVVRRVYLCVRARVCVWGVKIHRLLSSAGFNHYQTAGPTAVRSQKHPPHHCSLYFLLHTDIRNKTAQTHTHTHERTHTRQSHAFTSLFSHRTRMKEWSWLSTNSTAATGSEQVIIIPNPLQRSVFSSVRCYQLHPGCGLCPQSSDFLPTPIVTAAGVSCQPVETRSLENNPLHDTS